MIAPYICVVRIVLVQRGRRNASMERNRPLLLILIPWHSKFGTHFARIALRRTFDYERAYTHMNLKHVPLINIESITENRRKKMHRSRLDDEKSFRI